MLYHLVEKYRGKESIVLTDNLKKCKARKKEISTSKRKMNVEYSIVPAETNEKYQRLPAGDQSNKKYATPRLTKWKK